MADSNFRIVRGKEIKKKFVRYKEGANLYSMSQSKFEQMAKDAGAIYKLNKLVLVNMEVFDDYLESFRIQEGQTMKNTALGAAHGSELLLSGNGGFHEKKDNLC